MIYLQDFLQATGGKVHQSGKTDEFSGFAFDSRQLEPGQIFLAVKTVTGDGHDFIADAIKQGATGIICEHVSDNDKDSLTIIIVSDVQQALIDYAVYILKKYQPRVIGITGSNGKTTAKEAISAILQTKYKLFKNFGSYNGRYGLPISLGEITPDHEIAVLEMASDSFGEITELIRITQPEVGVVTTVHKNHLSYMGNLDNIAAEKGRLIESLPFTGAAILNADDPRVANMVPRTKARILTFGCHGGADIHSSNIKLTSNGLTFTLHYQGRQYQGSTSLLGYHHIYPILAAVAVGLIFDISPERSLAILQNLPRISGRMNPLPGRKGTLILDDSFSSSPEATIAALKTLAELPGATKVAILGDMPDLGKIELESHHQIGVYATPLVQRLVTNGGAAQEIAASALNEGLGKHAVRITFTNSDAVAAVEELLSPDTVILVKGGAKIRMEQIVLKLLANPKRDQKQLVRQEASWQEVKINQPARPTWVEIDLEAIANNVRLLVKMAYPSKVLAVLKGDAYGHGMVKVAHTALNNGIVWIGVATMGEAISLRQANIDAPILVMSYIPAWQAHDAIRYNISTTIFTKEIARAFSRAAVDLKKMAYIHIKVDTGMGRLGLPPKDVISFMQEIKLPNIKVEAVYTHFSTADDIDLSYARVQLQRFNSLLEKLKQNGLYPPLVHASNTAAFFNIPEARFDLARLGISLYGLPPSKNIPLPENFRPALSFKSTVGQVKTLPPNSPIGYGATYYTKKEETIAVIPVGYADGFRMAPRTWGEVLVKGQRAPLVGRVSMDQSVINITHIPNVRQGDEVVLIGKQGNESITAEEVAKNLGTINYEVVSELLARVPRES